MIKRITPVSWLVEQTRTPEWHSFKSGDIVDTALQMEANKQRKYDEMLEMLKDIKDYLGSDKRAEVEQLIKEATELKIKEVNNEQ